MEERNGRYKVRTSCPDGRIGCGVCHYAWIDVDAYNQIHDCYYDNYGRKPSGDTIVQIYKMLPEEIHNLAKQWDWDDTEVRDKVYGWMKERIVVFLK